MCVHIHLCLAERSRVGEGSCWGSISTLQQEWGWMSVLAIAEWNQLQNFLIGFQSHVVLVQSFINAVWSSTQRDKLLSPVQAITLHCFWQTAPRWVSELDTAGKLRFIQKSGWKFSESQETGAMLWKAKISKHFTGAGTLNFLFDIKYPMRSSVWITSMKCNQLSFYLSVLSVLADHSAMTEKIVWIKWPHFSVQARPTWRWISIS